MKGVILCGGLGTRLNPLTLVTNKSLLPVYDRPMVYWPIQTLVNSGIKDILLVCGGNAVGEFLRILGNGEQFGLKHLHYTYQKEPKGIADALSLAEEWADGEPITVILGDNIFENSIVEEVEDFSKNPQGAKIFVIPVDHPEHYGVVEIDNQSNVVSITEKPKEPKSNLIATGLYMYDASVWDFLKGLTPSKRNELEITDLNNRYLQMNKLTAVPVKGWWADAGESILQYNETCQQAAKIVNNQI